MVEFMNKSLENPLIASSCISTENISNILRLAENGVQAVILKSCADYQRKAVINKRQFAVDKNGYIYASSPFENEIMTLAECIGLMDEVHQQTEIMIIPSFTASSLSLEDWIPACCEIANAGADGIQLDFFYMGNIIGINGFSEKLMTLLKELIAILDIPIMPKLNINLPKDYIIPIIAKAGVQYVSLLDSVRSPFLEENDGKYQLSKRLDAQSTSCFGEWQLPLTLGYTYTAACNELKVCAGGGITCADDVNKLLAIGASTVQSATFLTKYPEKAGELILNV